MKDRVPTYPGRVKLTPVEGQENTYDMTRADQPTQAGTPLNKATLLKDETAEKLGLDPADDPTVDDALSKSIENLKRVYEVGDTLTTLRTDLGDKWLLCNGDAVSESEYPDLWNILNTWTGTKKVELQTTNSNIAINQYLFAGNYIVMAGKPYSDTYIEIMIYNKSDFSSVKSFSVSGSYAYDNTPLIYIPEHNVVAFFYAYNTSATVALIDMSTLTKTEYTATLSGSDRRYEAAAVFYDSTLDAIVRIWGPGTQGYVVWKDMFYMASHTFSSSSYNENETPDYDSSNEDRFWWYNKTNGQMFTLYSRITTDSDTGITSCSISARVYDDVSATAASKVEITTFEMETYNGEYTTNKRPMILDGQLYYVVSHMDRVYIFQIDYSYNLVNSWEFTVPSQGRYPSVYFTRFKNKYFLLFTGSTNQTVLLCNSETGECFDITSSLKKDNSNGTIKCNMQSNFSTCLLDCPVLFDSDGMPLYLSYYDNTTDDIYTQSLYRLDKALPVIASETNYVYIKAKE